MSWKKGIAGERRFNDFPISIKCLEEDLKYENVFLYDQSLSNMWWYWADDLKESMNFYLKINFHLKTLIQE